MKKTISIISLIIPLIILSATNLFSIEKQPVNSDNIEIDLCDCYNSQQINTSEFIDKKDNIQGVKTKCRKGFFMTGLTQSAEKDPINFGQYVIISDIECCRPCLKEKNK